MKKEEFEFLKTYYNLLKNKSNKDIGDRFLVQIKALSQNGEISPQTKSLIEACITIGVNGGNLDKDDFDILKEFIEMGAYIQEEKDSQKVANKLAEKSNIRSSTSSSTSDPCGTSHSTGTTYSGRSSGGC